MPLLRKSLLPVRVLSMRAPNEDSPDFYPGQAPDWMYTKTVKGNVQPAENKITSEMYGQRVHDMVSLILPLTVEVSESDRLSFSENDVPAYKPISIKHYSGHVSVLAEKVI